MVQEAALQMRPFGTCLDDLEVDFRVPRPVAITEVLARCADAGRERLWDLSVGSRIGLLLALAALNGRDEYEASTNCPECGLAIEVVLTLNELRAAASHHEDTIFVEQARFRLPTGRDQLEWLRFADEDEAALVERMIDSLCIEGSASPEAAEAALDAADPLMRTGVTAVCAQCGHSMDLEVDIVDQALQRLAARQMELLAGVHLLASRYHWSEPEIFALPAWRRNRYLELLREEKH